MTYRPLTQGEVEERLVRLSDAMEDTTHVHRDHLMAAAVAEVEFKHKQAQSMLAFASDPALKNAQLRDARALLNCIDELRAWKIAEAVRNASKEALLTQRSQIDATRTLSANVRAQT